MNKIGSLSVVVGIALLILFLIVVLSYFFGEGLLPQAAKAADWIADKTLAGIKKEQFEKKPLEIDKSVEETYNSILGILRTEGNGPCILPRKSFANDLKGFKILLSKENENTLIQLKDKQGQYIKTNTIPKKVPCIVGEGNVAKNFYDNYLDGTKCTSNCLKDYSAAEIEIRDSRYIYVNNQKRNLNDGNLVFRTKDGNICFFQTKDDWFSNCDIYQDVIDDDCIGTIKNNIKSC